MKNGYFIISLDFELMWGMYCTGAAEAYRDHITGVHAAVEAMLDAFEKSGIHATWAAVGFLFSPGPEALAALAPKNRPVYQESAFENWSRVQNTNGEDGLHYAPELLRRIAACPGQEIGSHTFSHYYCMEDGENLTAFDEDLALAAAAAEPYGLACRALVFPKNQTRASYLPLLPAHGFTCYRGNPESALYREGSRSGESIFRRLFRLADSYLNFTGHGCWNPAAESNNLPVNIRASRFLRPYSPALRFAEKCKLRRIERDMAFAAKNGLTYHLWWHPHNFGTNLAENMQNLSRLLACYRRLHEKYGFESVNMSQIADIVIKTGGKNYENRLN